MSLISFKATSAFCPDETRASRRWDQWTFILWHGHHPHPSVGSPRHLSLCGHLAAKQNHKTVLTIILHTWSCPLGSYACKKFYLRHFVSVSFVFNPYGLLALSLPDLHSLPNFLDLEHELEFRGAGWLLTRWRFVEASAFLKRTVAAGIVSCVTWSCNPISGLMSIFGNDVLLWERQLLKKTDRKRSDQPCTQNTVQVSRRWLIWGRWGKKWRLWEVKQSNKTIQC